MLMFGFRDVKINRRDSGRAKREECGRHGRTVT